MALTLRHIGVSVCGFNFTSVYEALRYVSVCGVNVTSAYMTLTLLQRM